MKFTIATILLASLLALSYGNVILDTLRSPPVGESLLPPPSSDVEAASAGIPAEQLCAPSVTTVSGPYAPGGQICQQQLILNENFNTFDMNLWRHEVTMNGGGVINNDRVKLDLCT